MKFANKQMENNLVRYSNCNLTVSLEGSAGELVITLVTLPELVNRVHCDIQVTLSRLS